MPRFHDAARCASRAFCITYINFSYIIGSSMLESVSELL